MTELDKRLDTREASVFLTAIGYTTAPATLNKLRCIGGGPVFEKFGRRPLYSETSLLSWVRVERRIRFALLPTPRTWPVQSNRHSVPTANASPQPNLRVRWAMTAEIVAKALGGRRAGGGWNACCPAHEDRKPSLSITEAKDGKVLIRCHAGCEQARVIALRSRRLWIGNNPRRFTRFAPRIVVAARRGRDEPQRTKAAFAIWRSATPAQGTLVETYLTSRGIDLPPPTRFASIPT